MADLRGGEKEEEEKKKLAAGQDRVVSTCDSFITSMGGGKSRVIFCLLNDWLRECGTMSSLRGLKFHAGRKQKKKN